jgi:hypothetical protein
MSMALHTLCLHPLLKCLEQKLTGIRIGRRARPTAVVASADNVTIFISSVTEFPIIEALQLIEKTSGASINPRKSKALAVGRWRAQETIRGIQYHPSVTVLGITFWATIDQTTARITGKVRMQAKKAYERDTCLARRIQYVHNCLLAKLWYTAQIPPLARPYSAINYSCDMVYMERSSLQSETINPTAPETDGGNGADRHCREVSGSPPLPDVSTRSQRQDDYGRLDAVLEPHWQTGKPATGHADPWEIRLSPLLCHRHGLYTTHRTP